MVGWLILLLTYISTYFPPTLPPLQSPAMMILPQVSLFMFFPLFMHLLIKSKDMFSSLWGERCLSYKATRVARKKPISCAWTLLGCAVLSAACSLTILPAFADCGVLVNTPLCPRLLLCIIQQLVLQDWKIIWLIVECSASLNTHQCNRYHQSFVAILWVSSLSIIVIAHCKNHCNHLILQHCWDCVFANNLLQSISLLVCMHSCDQTICTQALLQSIIAIILAIFSTINLWGGSKTSLLTNSLYCPSAITIAVRWNGTC